MNIEQAKTEIERSVSIYLMKDRFGHYRMDRQKQRPLFMLGAPGIGKTAVVAEIAAEMKLPLVSYSMTHHTRQSAIGLPFIEHRTYQGKEFDVSIYTLSEIIASVYEAMEKSGKEEGILFLDEINCVSETLAPAMLQFLQYKTFGNHDLPEGWIIVAAGNPQIFNRNARTFDIATLDRLKVLEVEADYQSWRKYALNAGVHPSVLSFLDIHKDYFFHVESGVEGKVYATPRGWEDLSQAMVLYEEKKYPVDEALVSQYIHDERITNAFAGYLRLYGKYQEAYSVLDILDGKSTAESKERMRKAGWDERISVTNLLLDAVSNEISEEQIVEIALRQLRDPLRELKESGNFRQSYAELADSYQKESEDNNMEYTRMERDSRNRMLDFLKRNSIVIDYTELQERYAAEAEQMMKAAEDIERHLENLLAFLKECASEQELLLAVTRLTVDQNDARFIAMHGCDAYYELNDSLNMQKRSEELMQEVNLFRGTE